MGRSLASSARHTTRKHASGFFGSPGSIEAPTTKDFVKEGGPVEIRQSSGSARCDKFDVLPLGERDQVADDRARLIRVVRGVGDDHGGARQLESILQMFGVGRIERLARIVASAPRYLSG